MSLFDISYESGSMAYERHRMTDDADRVKDYLEEAHRILDAADPDGASPAARPDVTLDFEELRWFPFPDEVVGGVQAD